MFCLYIQLKAIQDFFLFLLTLISDFQNRLKIILYTQMKYYQVLLLAALLSFASTYAIEGNWDSVDYNNTAISITALNTALNGRNNYKLQVIGCPSSNPFTILDSYMQVSSNKASNCSTGTPSQNILMQNLQEKFFYFQIYYSQLILVNVYGNKTLTFTRQKIDMKNYKLMGTFQNDQGNRLTITNQSIFLCNNTVKIDYSGNSKDSIRLINNTQQGSCNSSGKLIQALKNGQYYRLQNPNVLRVYDDEYKAILELNKVNNWNGTRPQFVAPANVASNISNINDSSAKGDKSVSTTSNDNSTLKNDVPAENKTNNYTIQKNSSAINSSINQGNTSKLSSKTELATNSSANSTSQNKSNSSSSSNMSTSSNVSSTQNKTTTKYVPSGSTNTSNTSVVVISPPSSNISTSSNISNSSLPLNSTNNSPNISSSSNGSKATNTLNSSNSSASTNTSNTIISTNTTNTTANISKPDNISSKPSSSNNTSQNISNNTKQDSSKAANSSISNTSNKSNASNTNSSSNISTPANTSTSQVKSNQTSNITSNPSQIVITGPINNTNYLPPKANQSSTTTPVQTQPTKTNFSTQYMTKVNELNPKTSNIKLNSGIAVGIWTPQFIMYNDQATWPTKYAINLTTIAFIGCNTVALPINFNFSGNAVKVGNTITSTRKACGTTDQPYIDLTKNASYYSVNSNGTGIRVSFFDANGKILFALFRNTTEKDKANLVFTSTNQIQVKQDVIQSNPSNQDKTKLNSNAVDASTPTKSSGSSNVQLPPVQIPPTSVPTSLTTQTASNPAIQPSPQVSAQITLPATPAPLAPPTARPTAPISNTASTVQSTGSEQKPIQSSFLTGRYNALRIGTVSLPQALSMRVNYVFTPQYIFMVGTCNQYVYPYTLTSQGGQTKINVAVDQVKINQNLGCDPSDDNLYIQPILKSSFIDAISTLQNDLTLYLKDSSKNPTLSLQKFSTKNPNK